jgi:4-carboxymuconolactone decarboxylase
MSKFPRAFERFQTDFNQLWQAYEALGSTAAEAGPLDVKSRELIKLGMAAANGSESAVKSHTHRALEAGVSPEEIQHALLLGITTIGFPTTMAGLTWSQSAIEDHTG